MKTTRAMGILVGVQLALVAVYLGVEHLRSEAPAFAVERLDEAAPPLMVVRAGAPAAAPQGPHLVHFWATWCAPCQEELPSLLAATEAAGVPLLAVTDEPWSTVARHFDGEVPSPIVRDPTAEAAGAWQVSGLPDTYVVRGGRVVGRMGGPRDWGTTEARGFLRELREGRTP